jgi:hypothetical protein
MSPYFGTHAHAHVGSDVEGRIGALVPKYQGTALLTYAGTFMPGYQTLGSEGVTLGSTDRRLALGLFFSVSGNRRA